MKPFSFDLARDGYVNPTTGMLAMQFAVYAGFTEVYCLGLHHGGKHFDGSASAPGGENMRPQRKFLIDSKPLLAERGVSCYLVGSSDPELFETRPFSEVAWAEA